jgi:hypothetical protein
VQILLKLVSHQAHGYVVSTESLAELIPQHLVAILKSGGEVSPPSTGLSIVHEPKHGLGDARSVIRLKQIQRLGEQRRVHHQEVGVGRVHHRLVVWTAHSTVHDVLRQHSHELLLCG